MGGNTGDRQVCPRRREKQSVLMRLECRTLGQGEKDKERQLAWPLAAGRLESQLPKGEPEPRLAAQRHASFSWAFAGGTPTTTGEKYELRELPGLAGESAQCHILFGITVGDWATLAECDHRRRAGDRFLGMEFAEASACLAEFTRAVRDSFSSRLSSDFSLRYCWEAAL